ncbi:MAG: glycoside hydrolase family 78 protein [Treponema sp.]|jgi:alpha-L-rhamnosidase|nr:glycoside hydrolase family 78 protein [Treponema sp.]
MVLNKYFVDLENEINPETEQPASYVRRTFNIGKNVKKANLIMTALGTYEGYVNGERLGKQILTPGFTDYNYRVQYQTYDVTKQLRRGKNVIAAIVGDGWYRGCIGIGSKRNCYGTKIKFMCRLELTYDDGTKADIYSDDSCRAVQDGPLRENNTKTIERVDARREMPDWNIPEFNDSSWHNVTLSAYSGVMIQQEGELILEQEKFIPRILQTQDGNTVLDMGQNFAGYINFTVKGTSGHTVVLTMGEVLDENGNFTMKNLIAEGAESISGEVGQRLEYTLKEGVQTYKPKFLISGFRYVLLENWPEPVKVENFTGIAVYSDIPQTGTFSCSNERINQLVRNVRWSEKSNFVDIPGDCPTRERSGWTADISVFAETACYISNPAKFLKKWLKDYMFEQSKDGNLPYVVPSAGKPVMQRGCMGWSDAIANVSLILYQFYGDTKVLADVYDTVKAFVEFNVERAKQNNPFFDEEGNIRREILAHVLMERLGTSEMPEQFKPLLALVEQERKSEIKSKGYSELIRQNYREYLIETGFHYGEWLEPGSKMFIDYMKGMIKPDTEITTAWFYQLTSQLADMAKILENEVDARHYRELSAKIRETYRILYLRDGSVDSDRQCRYVHPLVMGLADTEKKEAIAKKLNQMCIQNKYCIGTGFLSTYKLLNALSDNGYLDTAYQILENEKQPGWLYAVTKGATTTWENWYGLDENNVPVDSHNHFAPGAVVAWLFSHCAGIRSLEPGFKRIMIQPMPGGTLEYAACEYDSIQGKIVSNWRKSREQFTLHVEIPEGIPAQIILPDKSIIEVTGGTHDYECLLFSV